MGVRGLQKFLEEYCPAACSEVHLPTLISEYQEENYDNAEIIVDAQSCFQMWCDGLDWTIGLEVQELIDNLRIFVERFKDMGVEPVFFIGGATPEKKRDTWLGRRRQRIQQMLGVFDVYKPGKSFNNIPVDLADYVPPNVGTFVTFVLKYILNCSVHVTIEECDEEIIRYVRENDSFAIFANDTDFVISDVDCVILSSTSFNSEELTALRYDRRILCQSLNISAGPERLPLLAILAGNDLVSYETVRPFHCRLCHWPASRRHVPCHILIPALGRYVNNLHRTAPIEELLEDICLEVFQDLSRKDVLQVAYDSYFVHREPDPLPHHILWNRVLNIATDRVRNVMLPASAWGILRYRIYESSVCFEDLRIINDDNESTNEMPSATVTRPLRERFYGILFSEIRKSNPTITEWCADNVDSYQLPVIVNPVYVRAHHPGLRALWDSSRAHIHVPNRWKLFLKAVSPNITNFEPWKNLEEELILSAATCYYLFEEDFLSEWDLPAVLATIVMYSSYDHDDLRPMARSPHDLKAAQISITFVRTYSNIFSLWASCGHPVPLSESTAHIKFEPRLFQMIYRKIKRNASAMELCDHDEFCLQNFNSMKTLIKTKPSRFDDVFHFSW